MREGPLWEGAPDSGERSLEAALADCLERIESGSATLAEVMADYPHHPELTSLLELAQTIRALPLPRPQIPWRGLPVRALDTETLDTDESEWASALSECLDEVEWGGEEARARPGAHYQRRDELASLVELAQAIRAVPPPQPRRRLIAPLVPLPVSHSSSRVRGRINGWLRVAAPALRPLPRAAVVFLPLVLTWWALTPAATVAQPGEPLYPLKLLNNEVALIVNLDEVSRAEKRLVDARERLREAAESGLDPRTRSSLVVEAEHQTRLAVESLRSIDSPAAEQVLARAGELSQQEVAPQSAVASLPTQAPTGVTVEELGARPTATSQAPPPAGPAGGALEWDEEGAQPALGDSARGVTSASPTPTSVAAVEAARGNAEPGLPAPSSKGADKEPGARPTATKRAESPPARGKGDGEGDGIVPRSETAASRTPAVPQPGSRGAQPGREPEPAASAPRVESSVGSAKRAVDRPVESPRGKAGPAPKRESVGPAGRGLRRGEEGAQPAPGQSARGGAPASPALQGGDPPHKDGQSDGHPAASGWETWRELLRGWAGLLERGTGLDLGPPAAGPTATPAPTPPPTAVPTAVPTLAPPAVPTATAPPTVEAAAVDPPAPLPTAVPTSEPTVVPTATPEPIRVSEQQVLSTATEPSSSSEPEAGGESHEDESADSGSESLLPLPISVDSSIP